MTMEEFTLELQKKLESLLDNSYSVIVRSFQKNNIGKVMALNITKEENAITPNFYLQDLFKCYQQGDRSIMEMAKSMVECYRKTVEENRGCGIAEGMMQEDWVRKRLIFRLLNYSENEEVLQETAHIRFLDLALVYYVLVKEEEEGMGTIRASRELFQTFGWDEKAICEEVLENTVRMLPVHVETILDVLHNRAGELSPEVGAVWEEPGGVPLVLTNKQGINGAAAIIYPEVLREIAEKRNSNLILLPSSIHEFLVISDEEGLDREEMVRMVKEVNRTCVLPEERLSENVYYYDFRKDSLSIGMAGRKMQET